MSLTGDQILRRVAAALTQVTDPRSGDDVISSGRVRELQAADDGVVRFRFMLQPEDPGSLVRDVRAAAERVDGVSKVRIDVGLPAAAGKPARPTVPHGVQRAGTIPAPTPQANLLPGVQFVVAVSSGKGGVGKSTVAVNLATALAAKGLRVGLLDADVYGPNVPTMLGEKRKPRVTGGKGSEKIEALEAHGVRLMSLGLLLEESQPAIMRGPLIAGVLKQFLEQVQWGELDYMIVDMPPGTGDAQLSLVQTVNVDGVVMVTTPQDVSTGDVRRAIKMFERVNTPILGVVENMSGFVCPCCGTRYDLFGRGGGRALADGAKVPFLGEIPLEMAVRESGDAGRPIVLAGPDTLAGEALFAVAEKVIARLAEA
jgi:ATP-binding protein involved in chromosome partitioning